MAAISSLVAAGIGAAGAVGAAAMSSKASKSAANAQAQSNQLAVDYQRDAQQQARVDSAPFMIAGQSALYSYMDELGLSRPREPVFFNPNVGPIGSAYAGTQGGGAVNALAGEQVSGAVQGSFAAPAMTQARGFMATPGYQYQVGEAEKGVLNRLNALGLMGSGAALKELTRTRQGIAAGEYNNYLNRLQAMAGMGQTQTNQGNALNASTANNISNITQQTGQARASSMLGQAAAWNGAIGNLTSPSGPMVNALMSQNWGGMSFSPFSQYRGFEDTRFGPGTGGIY